MEFNFDPNSLNKGQSSKLVSLCDKLMADFMKNSLRKSVRYKATGAVDYDEFNVKKSKQIIDRIDSILAKHYKFTDEELDFIINYDIKYRMGADDGGGGDR